MARLLLALQYPARLRYQQWWYTELPKQYQQYFDEVVVLGDTAPDPTGMLTDPRAFSSPEASIELELVQIREYMSLTLRSDDVLLLCDLSYPGLFANVLWHKRPAKAFAICHATSRNRYDIFAPVRGTKYPTEKAHGRLFDSVFVASHYHSKKLGWDNIMINPFPYPPKSVWAQHIKPITKTRSVITVSRSGIQKRTPHLERAARRCLGLRGRLIYPNLVGAATRWEQYYACVASAERLLSTAKEETFGYQIVDAVLSGTVPIAPARYSYPELLPEQYLYRDEEELIERLRADLPVPELLRHQAMLDFYRNTAGWMLA